MADTSITARRVAWSHPHLERKLTESTGYTLVATAPIAKGTLLVVWGGIVVDTATLRTLPEIAQQRSIQVEEDLYLTPGMLDDLADCVNHSCNPNAGLQGQIALVALRDIAAGEEVCFDYAMSDGDPEFRMTCLCGQPNCRGVITGDDWRIPELQQRYQGYFSPYLQRRIARLNGESS
ncbi:MAG: SET domain-containing protein-lysine N-methyltransferase [Chloroflexi bacterium]|jgi:hypothetical protein|nr:SET domain-containing protein-lysine N-methyltransferase [Chloroflexota bacterium]